MQLEFSMPPRRKGPVRRPLAERFWEKVAKAEGDGCWLWTGATYPNGYGFIHPDERHTALAHRLAYEWAYGSLPAGILACHSCDVRYAPEDRTYRRCVRPSHMFPGTHGDNSRDMAAKGRQRHQQHPEGIMRGSDHPRAKLTEAIVADARLRCENGETSVSLSLEYGVSESVMAQAIRGYTWRHVPNPLKAHRVGRPQAKC